MKRSNITMKDKVTRDMKTLIREGTGSAYVARKFAIMNGVIKDRGTKTVDTSFREVA